MSNETTGFMILLALVVCMGAWITHIVHCLLYAKYLLLIAGGFVFPIGVIHGFGIWFGMSW